MIYIQRFTYENSKSFWALGKKGHLGHAKESESLMLEKVYSVKDTHS